MKKQRTSIELLAATAFLLHQAPRTRPEVRSLLALNRSGAESDYINALMAEGLVEELGRDDNERADGVRRGVGAMRYGWVKKEPT